MRLWRCWIISIKFQGVSILDLDEVRTRHRVKFLCQGMRGLVHLYLSEKSLGRLSASLPLARLR